MGTYNGEMLRVARQFRGRSQRDLAAAIFAEPSTMSRVENGILQPSADFARKVHTALRFPASFFERPDRVYGLPISVHPMWRKKAAVLQHDIDRTLAELNIRMMHLRQLIRSVEYVPIAVLPRLDVENHEGGPEEIAAIVRRMWLMPAGPIANLTEWVERTGCFVIHVDLPDAAMDGVTLQAPDTPPCIFINKRQPADRMRFTLAHELGHLVMHRLPTLGMEKEANTFASALLMPAIDITPYFRQRSIDLPRLAALKPEWRVSMQGLLYRAKYLGFVTEGQARYLWQQFNIHKIKVREPAELDFSVEKQSLMTKLLEVHFGELSYSIAEFSEMLDMYESEIRDFYTLQQPPNKSSKPLLRVVT